MAQIIKKIEGEYRLADGEYPSNVDVGAVFQKCVEREFPGRIAFETLSTGGRHRLFKCHFNDPIDEESHFFIYTLYCTSGGGDYSDSRSKSESRAQVNPHASWRPDLSTLRPSLNFQQNEDLTGRECYIFIVYAVEGSAEDVVISALHPQEFKTFEIDSSSSRSFQNRVDNQLEALNKGFSYTHKSGCTPIINFIPKYLLWYMKNRDQLHMMALEKFNQIVSSLEEKAVSHPLAPMKELNMIFYGAPGTGKSTRVSELTKDKDKTVVTFHPDTDYAAFVGSYKPCMNGDNIAYQFVPQAFARAYVEAWKDLQKEHYLVIEEINRGNCAQIFGDIFQLLDRREDGFSSYVIDVDKDFADYLEQELKDNKEYQEKITALCKGTAFSFSKIALPPSLRIYATMNTSDQSLFPMDSAFKRRWEWEYVPIDLESARKLHILIGSKKYSWGDFLEAINKAIKNVTRAEDKQIGNFFVKATDNAISFDQFRSKVMFYLWYEIFRDEAESKDTIFRTVDDREFSFADLFGKTEEAEELMHGFMGNMGINPIE